MSYAALSATTANTIQGTPPYLTFDGGITKASTTDELLMIKLSDGTVYKRTNAAGTVTTPIVLPAGDSFADIDTLIPNSTNSISLSTLVVAPYNYAMDDDGDGNFSATGSLSISITDVNGTTVNRTSSPDDSCKAPYKVTLTSTSGILISQFGAPNSSTFNASTATYYVNAGKVPSACFAKPNLIHGTWSSAGPASQWDSNKGFKVQDVDTPSSNFPTIGFNGAFFDLTLSNTTAAQVIADSNAAAISGTSNVSLTLSAISTNVLRVELLGPSSGQTGGLGRVAVTGLPASFELKSGTKKLYSFSINKWFIPRATNTMTYPNTVTYCGGITGFRLPSVLEYMNGFTAAQIVPGGSTGEYYTRTINGGIFAEWGDTSRTYYTNSNWEKGYYYWASESYGGVFQYLVSSGTGVVGFNNKGGKATAACVSP